ncbi:Taste receptor type 1 member 2 [Haplosporangium gracile]|nr:Taste receptor type 1 member 2 [Haplosporangium gracile]
MLKPHHYHHRNNCIDDDKSYIDNQKVLKAELPPCPVKNSATHSLTPVPYRCQPRQRFRYQYKQNHSHQNTFSQVSSTSAIRLAVNDINAQKILPGIRRPLKDEALAFFPVAVLCAREYPVRSPFGGSNAMLSAANFVTSNISAVIGDTISRLSEYSATVTSAVHIPQCSFTSISDDLSSRALYDYFIRTVPTGDKYAVQMLEYINSMGWRRIGIIYCGNSFGVSFATSIVRRAPSYGVMITYWGATYTPNSDSQDFNEALGSLRSVGSYINMILCTAADTLRGLETI